MSMDVQLDVPEKTDGPVDTSFGVEIGWVAVVIGVWSIG
jgi:hypothetical protein